MIQLKGKYHKIRNKCHNALKKWEKSLPMKTGALRDGTSVVPRNISSRSSKLRSGIRVRDKPIYGGDTYYVVVSGCKGAPRRGAWTGFLVWRHLPTSRSKGISIFRYTGWVGALGGFQSGSWTFQHGSSDGYDHRVHTEWHWHLSGIHSIMMVNSAQPGKGGLPLSHYHHKQSGIRSSWEGRYTPPISPLPLSVLRGYEALPSCVGQTHQRIFKGTQEWEFFWLRFWNLYFFVDS